MKPRIFSDALLRDLAAKYGTPLYVYDAATIAARAKELLDTRAFDLVRYAQKANPNLAILRLLRETGCRVDAVSAGELHRALAAGFAASEVQFCADLFDRTALALVAQHPFEINLGSPDMLEQLARVAPGRRVMLRINPGFGHGHGSKVHTGGEHSKHGIWHRDLPATISRARELGLGVVGLHVHIGSGSDREHLERVRGAMLECAREVRDTLEVVSCGGGLPIPYREGEARFDVASFAKTWSDARGELDALAGRRVRLEIEPGRFLVAEAGALLCEVRGRKRSGAFDYVLVDAGFHNLIRPAFYGAYHEISVVGRDGEPRAERVVAGPLCESADVFTQASGGKLDPRPLPDARVGDLICIHDAGAYAASMASNYNSQLLAAEILVENGAPRVVRARQTFDDLLRSERASSS